MKTLITFITVCCFSLQLALSSIIVEGKVSNYAGKTIDLTILFSTYYVYGSKITIDLNEDGSFSQELELESLRFANLLIGEAEIGLLLDPNGNDIKLEVDIENLEGIKFLGENTELGDFINEWYGRRYFKEYATLSDEEKNSLEKLDTYCQKQKSSNMETLESLKNEIHPQTFELLQAEISYHYLGLKIHSALKMGYKGTDVHLSEAGKENEKLFLEMECDHSFDYLPGYNAMLNLYETHKKEMLNLDFMRGDTTKILETFGVGSMVQFMDLLSNDNYNRETYELVKDWTCSEGLIKLLANRIVFSHKITAYENLYWLYERFLALNPPSDLTEKIAPLMLEYRNFELSKDESKEGIHFFPTKAFEQSVLSILKEDRYKDKVLVIDMWGTWCGPCREQFPYLKEIKEKLQAEKDLIFIYLSAEKTRSLEQKWKETVIFFELKGDHYLVNKEILFQFKVDIDKKLPGAYPTYLIFDRKGEALFAPAALPSASNELQKQIELALSKE